VTFSAISTWRRDTFDDFAGVFQDAALPAPTDTEFDQSTRQANYVAQLSASAQPMPPRPGAAQPVPHQNPVVAPVPPASKPATGGSAVVTSATHTAVAKPAAHVALAKPIELRVGGAVIEGHAAFVQLSGVRPATKVAVRTSRGKVVAQGVVRSAGKIEVRVPTTHLAAGRHRYTVMFADTAGRHHTRNVTITVKNKPKREH
jgi:phospholipase C